MLTVAEFRRLEKIEKLRGLGCSGFVWLVGSPNGFAIPSVASTETSSSSSASSECGSSGAAEVVDLTGA